MSIAQRNILGRWNSRTTFMLALTASAIGLGNIWRFSYLVGENGGGPFVLTYLMALLLVAAPVLIAEVIVGSHGRGSPVASMAWARTYAKAGSAWSAIGWLAILAGLLILSYYCVVAGWSLAYTVKMQTSAFADASALVVAEQFDLFLEQPQQLVYWQSLFLAAVTTVVALGLRLGLKVCFWLSFPAMLLLLGVLLDYSFERGDVETAQHFLFGFNVEDFTAQSILIALGHAFFTLGIGVGAAMIFGAYAPEKVPLGRTVVAVALLDSVIAIAFGLVVFPLVFANNLEPNMGPGLLFISLPYAFGNMVQGEFFGTLFFALVSLAALGSAVALMEPVVAYLVQTWRLRRVVAAALVGLVTWLLGLGSVLSFNQWSDWYWLGQMTFFQLLDFVTTAILLPLSALMIALFVGWVMRCEVLRIELYREEDGFFYLWRGLLRYIAPLFIVMVFIATLAGLVN